MLDHDYMTRWLSKFFRKLSSCEENLLWKCSPFNQALVILKHWSPSILILMFQPNLSPTFSHILLPFLFHCLACFVSYNPRETQPNWGPHRASLNHTWYCYKSCDCCICGPHTDVGWGKGGFMTSPLTNTCCCVAIVIPQRAKKLLWGYFPTCLSASLCRDWRK